MAIQEKLISQIDNLVEILNNGSSQDKKKVLEEDSKVVTIDNFIGNKFVKPRTNKYFDNVNPATNEVTSYVANSNADDIDDAVTVAQKAFKSWSLTSIHERGRYLNAIANEIESSFDELIHYESRDNGETIGKAKDDIQMCIDTFRCFASHILSERSKSYMMTDAINYVQKHPLGVVGLIIPWNYPLWILSWKVSPCIACGNTCIVKPSELSPYTSHLFCKILQKINLPAGVVNIVHGYGDQVGKPLCEHPKVAGISFTGGTLTGSKISGIAAPLFKKLQLEMGGKNASIVFADCDFDTTIDEVCRAGFYNQGEVCTAGSRIFVEESLYDSFVEAFVKKAKQTYSDHVGNPLDTKSTIGSLVSLKHREKVEGYVKLAEKEGGKIILGGKRPDHLAKPFDQGAFYLPTIIINLSYNSRCATEEIFGPVVTIHSFKTEKDAIQMCNYVKYGLAASVWTTNVNKGHRIAQNIQSGVVWVNCWENTDLRAPFGGVKQSGIGREGGIYSMEFYTHHKNVCVKIDNLELQ